MEQDVLNILDFDQIRSKLVELAPSTMAKIMASELTPSSMPEIIDQKLTETEEAVILLQREVSSPLGETHDIRKILEKAQKDIILLSNEFIDLNSSLLTYKSMNLYFAGERHLRYPVLEEISRLIEPLDRLTDRIGRVFDEHGEVKDSAVPVKEEYRYKFKGIVHDRSSTGQTLFMEPMESIQLNNDLAELSVEESQEIQTILKNLTDNVKKNVNVISKDFKVVSELEFILTRAKLALNMKGVRAVYSPKGILDLKNARHPLIPEKSVVPVSLTLGKDFNILIITGSNAGGKTIAMKTAGLLSVMNQCGLFIPADEGSTLPVYKHIYAIIGDDQSIQYNLSTFSSYVTQLSDILKNVNSDDLVLLDELGSGTDPIEGASLAQSITEFLNDRNVSSLITSHFNEMKKLAYETEGLENAFVEFDEITLGPTYHLVIGMAGSSNAFNICKRLEIPDGIIERAEDLKKMSPLNNMEEVMAKLNAQSRELSKERTNLQNQMKEIGSLKDKLLEESDKFNAKRESILAKTREESENIKRNLRIQSEIIIKDLKKNAAEIERGNVNNIASSARNKIDGLKMPKNHQKREPIDPKTLKVGQRVFIDTLDSDGVIKNISGSQISVQCGMLKVSVSASHCFKPLTKENNAPKSGIEARHIRRQHQTSSVNTVHTSLNVIGKTVSEAIPEVDRFLNDCFMAGVSFAHIIHGKGTGSLRRGIHDHLRTLNFIKEFHEADAKNGGAGATDVYF